jgi:hypothetical protein
LKSIALVCLASALFACWARSQQPETKISKPEREEVRATLDTISNDIKKHYYDPKLHGAYWDANIRTYREKIDNAASLNHGLSEVAAALDVLNDSHTFFLPPRPYVHPFGWQIGMIGDNCFVLAVRPGATPKGLGPGHQP